MRVFTHKGNPLTAEEWEHLLKTVRAVGNSTVSRKFIDATDPFGAGFQTVPPFEQLGITEGYKRPQYVKAGPITRERAKSDIIPLITKDFVVHWRDLEESRLTGQVMPMAKAGAAASSCAGSEDKLVFFGHSPLGYKGIMTIEGRNICTGLKWGKPGYAFENFKAITGLLTAKGFTGPFAAVVPPLIYSEMHRVLKGSSLLEISHVRALLTGGVFRSSLLAPRSGFVVSRGRHNLELLVSMDTAAAFLGARKMNLPFRVFKAIYLSIYNSKAICTF